MAPEQCFLLTTPGLEAALSVELKELGLEHQRVEGGVEANGPLGTYRVLNLELATASRVLLRIAEDDADSIGAAQRLLSSVDLAPYLAPGCRVRLNLSASQGALPLRELDPAVRAVFPMATAQDERVIEVYVRSAEGRLAVSVDTSGELLYRRGYRQEISRAPLRETLAAGMLLLAGYDPRAPVWDPMCGSGTLCIEAAWRAMRRAPGRFRSFAFEQWPSHDGGAWEALLAKVRGRELSLPPGAIIGTDIHAGALGQARRNARRAEVQPFLRLERADASTVVPDAKLTPGLIVTNPPYGIRVGDKVELPELFARWGAQLRRAFQGWRIAVLVPAGTNRSSLGLEVERAYPLENGGIRCELLVG